MTLPINTIRTGSDVFAMNKSGLIYTNTPLDCTSLTQVDGITATGSQPADTDRRVAFKVDGTWYKLSGSGAVTLSALTTQTLTADSVLAEGNTVAELAAATSISLIRAKACGLRKHLTTKAPAGARSSVYKGLPVAMAILSILAMLLPTHFIAPLPPDTF